MNKRLTTGKLAATAVVCAGAFVVFPSAAVATEPVVAVPGWACVPTVEIDSDGGDFTTCVSVDDTSRATLQVAHDSGAVQQWWLEVSARGGSTVDRGDLVETALEVTAALAPDDADTVAGLTDSDTGSAYGDELAYRVSGTGVAGSPANQDLSYLNIRMTAGVGEAPTNVVTASAVTSSVSTTALRLELESAGMTCVSGHTASTAALTCDGLAMTLVGNRVSTLEISTTGAAAALSTLGSGGLVELGADLPALLASSEPRTTVIGDLAVTVEPGGGASTVIRADL